MDNEELSNQLTRFCRAQLQDAGAVVSRVRKAPGHAGFSYFFDVTRGAATEGYVLRLPPPGVKLEGTADVLRQVCALKALDGTGVPHAPVVWSGDDPQWFGTPFFVTPRLAGNVLSLKDVEAFAGLPAEVRRRMAEQAMTALAGIHQVDWRAKAGTLGAPIELDLDVLRWERFCERAAEPQALALFPTVRARLLERKPKNPQIGLYHGDYQWGNLFYAPDGTLLAVLDWELTGIGATLNDLGWILTFSEPGAWALEDGVLGRGLLPAPDDLLGMYVKALGSEPADVSWFRALAAYKFAVITGFNLMLHRRGKRHDPEWEVLKDSMPSLMTYALECLGG
ncbi:MAG: phosphotransferase family protein [bacterium]